MFSRSIPTGICAFLLLASAPQATQAPDEKPKACCSLFPLAQESLVVETFDGEQPSLMTLVEDYVRITGQHLVLNEETRRLLETRQAGFTRRLDVPPAEVQSFFEAMLVAHDFVLDVLRDREPRLVTVVSLQTQARNTIRGNARFVRVENIAHYAEHPSMLVSTVVPMPYTDVRQLSNSMRTMITDANTQQMLPVGNTRTMALVGFGPSVADLVQFLQITDAHAKAWQEEHGEEPEEAADEKDTDAVLQEQNR